MAIDSARALLQVTIFHATKIPAPYLGEAASLASEALELALESGLLQRDISLLLHRRLQLRLRCRQLLPAPAT